MRVGVVGVVGVLVALPSCKPRTIEEGGSSTPPTRAAADVGLDDGSDPARSNVTIDPRIVALCGISEPSFNYNEAFLSQQARITLDALATCFVSGPAAGKNMRLVGHADPRGDEEYNFGLGQRRADTVAKYLGARGLGTDRVETSSRGKLDATGTDEAGWAQDRKVQILLAE